MGKDSPQETSMQSWASTGTSWHVFRLDTGPLTETRIGKDQYLKLSAGHEIRIYFIC